MTINPRKVHAAMYQAAITMDFVLSETVDPPPKHNASFSIVVYLRELSEVLQRVTTENGYIENWKDVFAIANQMSCVSAGVPATSWHHWAWILTCEVVSAFGGILDRVKRSESEGENIDIALPTLIQEVERLSEKNARTLPTRKDIKLLIYGLQSEILFVPRGGDEEENKIVYPPFFKLSLHRESFLFKDSNAKLTSSKFYELLDKTDKQSLKLREGPDSQKQGYYDFPRMALFLSNHGYRYVQPRDKIAAQRAIEDSDG